MTDSVHKDLTGADLHEPKGADTALAGQVYVSDGAGSGAWTTASSVITNSAWSTGDLKATHKTTADTGWVLWIEGSIGDSSSSATIRANADCADLFALYWNNYSDTLCPVSSGRGASAAADFAAHKKLTIPLGPGRAVGIAGSGANVTTRTLGNVVGSETHALSIAELAAHTHANTLTDVGHSHGYNRPPLNSLQGLDPGGKGCWIPLDNSGPTLTDAAVSGITINNASVGSGDPHNNMQPTTFVNMMIKL